MKGNKNRVSRCLSFALFGWACVMPTQNQPSAIPGDVLLEAQEREGFLNQ
ncbi:MAG: hypothetical protein O3A95_04825 [Planctomycetota bacterium]|nr:hypothetical protein [Planctomycetota bacterium]MDA1113607.1 hypothetical protein [Planctomycetota bacterium]